MPSPYTSVLQAIILQRDSAPTTSIVHLMANVAGIVVGVLSLTVEAIKVYRELDDIFHAIRGFSRELSQFSRRTR